MSIKSFAFAASFLLLSVTIFSQSFPGKIGVGLDGIGGVALEFPNVTLTAGAWQSVANSGNLATTDAMGWPTEDFRVVFFDHRPFNAWNNAPDDPEKYVVDPSGTYSLSFKGQATLTSWCDAPILFQNQQYNPVNNTTTVDILFPPGGGPNAALIGNYGFFMLNFLQTDYENGSPGVKEIRLIRPGYPHNTPQIFRTAYLNALSPFSTLRFMDFIRTNNSDGGYPNTLSWNERQQPNAPRYKQGAPWETIIALANYTGKDIWINIPVDADSLYVVNLAMLMHTTLRPDVNIYLEYSNEVWNGGFSQFQYNYAAVLQSPEDADIRASTPFDDRRRARRVAKQVIKFGKIFENVMGVSVSSRTRIRPVFAWQIGGWLPWYEDVLNWINTTYGTPKEYIFGIASAPYFSEGSADPNATPQEIVAAMSATSDENVPRIQILAQYAAQWGLKHLQYEGGPDNGGGSTTNIGNRITANRLPEMKTAILHNYQDNWFSENANGTALPGTNDLINYFVLSGKVSRYGCWGATEDLNYLQDLSHAPKYAALCELSGNCGNEPLISLLSPLNQSIVEPNTTHSISAEATDPDGTIQKVEFFVGATLLGVDSIAPFAISWTPQQIGTVAILAKAIDNQGKYRFTETNVVEVALNISGTQEPSGSTQLQISPNPAGGNEIELFVTNRDPLHGSVSILDLLGRVIRNKAIHEPRMKMELSGLAAGTYFLSLREESGEQWVKKFVVIRP